MTEQTLTLEQAIQVAITHQQNKEYDQAKHIYNHVLQSYPNHADALQLKGVLLTDEADYPQAITHLNKALSLVPQSAWIRYNLARAYQLNGDYKLALDAYNEVLVSDSTIKEAYLGRAEVQNIIGDYQNNIAQLSHLKTQVTQSEKLWLQLAHAHKHNGDTIKALEAYTDIIAYYPNSVDALECKAGILLSASHLKEAKTCFEKILQINENYAGAYYGLGLIAIQDKQYVHVIKFLERAVILNPENMYFNATLLHAYQHVCDWQKFSELEPVVNTQTQQAIEKQKKPGETPFTHITRSMDEAKTLEIAKLWARPIVNSVKPYAKAFNHQNRKQEDDAITIGYLSPDFRNYPTAHLMCEHFALHTRPDFKIVGLSTGSDDGSHYRKTIQEGCDRFIDLMPMSNAKAAQAIYDEGVDILIDLQGYMSGSRLEIPAQRPAPIQISYMCLVGTSGATFFDYILADEIIIPKDHSAYYSEELLYMPTTYWPTNNKEAISKEAISRKAQGLPDDAIVLCSFNWGYKFEPMMFDIWLEILKAVPNAVLWLLESNDQIAQNIHSYSSEHGVDPARIIFASKLEKSKHLARIQLADLALDTRICGGHTTSSDALWAGVPVITLQGSHYASRVCSSLLNAMQMNELVLHDLGSYKDYVIDLCKDTTKRQKLRQKVANKKQTAALFNTEQFVTDLEEIYRQLWQRYCKS